MPPSDPRRPLTLEQLLQLKRAERPDAEFWTRFERELHQKQLAALVERHAWWQAFPRFLSKRAYLPVGATAIIALTLVTVRVNQPAVVATDDARLPVHSEAAPQSLAAGPVRSEAAPEVPAAPEQPAAVLDDRTAIAAQPLSERLPERVLEHSPWSAARHEDSPSARTMAANLARLQETEPELVNSLLGAGLGDASRVEELATHAMEMAAVSAVASRRSRLLAQFSNRQFTPDPSAPEVFRERITRRLSEAELAEGWTRVGVKADRVSLKF